MAAESRFEAGHRAGLTPLVGREHEIGLLLERWSHAKGGDGQVVLLSGEAGIGKSRITETLRQRTAGDEPVRLRYQCSPFYTNTALHPVIEQFERVAQFEVHDSSKTKLDKLESLLAQAVPDAKTVALLFATLLSIPSEGRYAPLEIAPEQQKLETLEALISQMKSLSKRRPVLLIYEDIHWADPTSLELLELIIERAQTARVLVVLTYRPEFISPWSGHTHVTSLTLNRFTRSLASAVVENVTGGKKLPAEVLEHIIEKTDGVPLFVEELTKTILESGLLTEESDRYVAAGPLQGVAIPATLHDSLMARLDRLGTVKDTAQTAATIGREFDYDLLAAISPLSFEKLRDALNQLVDSELVFRRGRTDEGGYIFKHALVQDAAYGSLLKRNRQALHQRIAQTLRDRFPERVETQPELLAHHFTEAGMAEPAVELWKKAGLRAMDVSANVEAVSHLTEALELFVQLPDANERPDEELSLQGPLANLFFAVRGWTAPETEEAYFRARELCNYIDDTSLTFPVMYGVWNFYFASGLQHKTLKHAQELLELAERDGDRTRLMAVQCALGQTLTTTGRLDAGQQHLEASIRLYQPETDHALWQEYSETPPLMAMDWRSWVVWLRGFPDQAVAKSYEAIEATQAGTDMMSAAVAPWFQAWVYHSRGDFAKALEMVTLSTDFSTENDVQPIRILGTVLKGRAMLDVGQIDEGSEVIRAGVTEWQGEKIGLYVPWALSCLAESHEYLGNLEGALKVLDEALQEAERRTDVNWLAEIHRLRGKCLLSLSPTNAFRAETSYRKALDVAREQNGKSLELRATSSLAQLYKAQAKRDEARNLLAPVYDWFTEGFDSADLKAAKGLLAELS